MTNNTTYFIYGLCVMFYSMMAWMFWRKGDDRLSRLITVLMLIIDVECLKDLAVYSPHTPFVVNTYSWRLITAVDMVVIPFYNFILKELVKPGWLTWRKGVAHEIPFVLLPMLYAVTSHSAYFYALVVWGFFYGSVVFVRTFFHISQYHRLLKQRFSYEDNINLNWLRSILLTFFLILGLWTLSSFMKAADYDNLYSVGTLVLWMTVDYFVYRHESVIDEISCADMERVDSVSMAAAVEEEPESGYHPSLGAAVEKLFREEKLYLSPRLKLSDVARQAGTNRTYLSQYFNQDKGQTFYDYVNRYRVRHAEHLLATTHLSLVCIAEQSGFNSVSTFCRVFTAAHQCSPSEYRERQKP